MTPEEIQELMDKQKAELTASFAEREQAIKAETAAQIKALNEENKNRRLTSKELIEAIGIEKVEGKTEGELAREQINLINTELATLRAETKAKDEMLTLTQKQREAEKIATALNIDVDYLELAMSKVDLKSEIPINDQLNDIVVKYPKILKQAVTFGKGNPPSGNEVLTLRAEFNALNDKPKLTITEIQRFKELTQLLK